MPLLSRLRNSARRAPDVFGSAALLLVCLAVFWPLLSGKAFFFGDLEIFFYPLTEFWHRALVTGHFPLWNPNLFGGVSFVGNPQIGLLYPGSVLLLFFPAITALCLSAIFHIWASGTFFFLWMRRGRLQLAPSAALLGALCWMLGGALISKSQFPNMLAALAYLPAVMWAGEALTMRPTMRSATILGAVLGLQLLAGHAQVTLYTGYLLLFYTLWVWKTSPRIPLGKVAAGLGFALGLACLLDAGQLVPVLESLRGAERQVLTTQTAPRFYLPPWAVTNLFAPYFYGNPNSGTWSYGGGGNAWETACYLGVLPFLLAMRSFKRDKFWATIAVVNLILAFGPMGGLYLLAFHVVPGLSRFHDSARFLMLSSLGFAVLASLGFQKLREMPKMGRFVPALLLFCALDLGIFAHGFYPLRAQSQIPVLPELPHSITTTLAKEQTRIWNATPKIGRGLLLNDADYNQRTPAHDALFPIGSVPNTQVWDGYLEAGGYDPFSPAVVAARLKTLEIPDGATRFPDRYAATIGKDSIQYLAIWSKHPLPPTPELPLVYQGTQTILGRRLSVYENTHCLPRAVVVSKEGDSTPANISEMNTNQLDFTVSARADNFHRLIVLDNFLPGWLAYQGSSALTIRRTAAGYKGINLKATDTDEAVRLTYAPESFRFGVFLTLCALSATVGILSGSRKSATKKPETK